VGPGVDVAPPPDVADAISEVSLGTDGPHQVTAAGHSLPDTARTIAKGDQPESDTAKTPGERTGPPPRRRPALAAALAAAVRSNPRLAVGATTGIAMVVVLILVVTLFSPSHKKQALSPGSQSASSVSTSSSSLRPVTPSSGASQKPKASAAPVTPHPSRRPRHNPATSPPATALPPPATAPAPAPAPSATCSAMLRITAPAEDAIIANGGNGVVVSGTACDLGSDSGWLFDFDPQDGYYYDDYSGSTPAPVVQPSQTGAWQFPDSPIGDPGDQNKLYVITLVLAPPSCARSLSSEPQIDGDYKLRTLPAECSIADQVDVYVTYP
jgi:hypothetical protein